MPSLSNGNLPAVVHSCTVSASWNTGDSLGSQLASNAINSAIAQVALEAARSMASQTEQ